MMPEFSIHILQTDICIYYMMQNKDRRTDLRIYYMMWEYIRIVFSVHILQTDICIYYMMQNKDRWTDGLTYLLYDVGIYKNSI